MQINIKKLTGTAKIPTRGSYSAAGYDLYSNESSIITIQPHTTYKIHTGIAVEIPEGYFGAIFARSGIATKRGLRPANCVGVIDADYRGEVIVALHNDTETAHYVPLEDRVAQLIVIPFMPLEFNEVAELSSTERDIGGFGSTDENTGNGNS